MNKPTIDTIDWKKGPGYKVIGQLEMPSPIVHTLDNGIPVYEVLGGSQEVTKVDIVFKGGRIIEEKQLTSRFVAALIREGSSRYNSSDFAEVLDFYGVNLKSASNLDYNYISFSCLNKHLEEVLPSVADMILAPSFEEDELEKYKRKSIESLQMDMSKNELIAYRAFTSLLYGDDHPYGYNTEKETIESITIADVKGQYNRLVGHDNAFIILTGRPPVKLVSMLNQDFGQFRRSSATNDWTTPVTNHVKFLHKTTRNEFQAAIKIGRRVLHRTHPEYPTLFILNAILGGYFGSRLMSEIREEQGLTYNIYSTIDNLRYDSYFYIATDVDPRQVDTVIVAIQKEILGLQEDLVSDEELDMVRNYLMGNFLTLIDGPFLLGALMRSLLAEGVDLEHFRRFYKNIQSVSPEMIRACAQQYLQWDDMVTVVVAPEVGE